MRRLIIVPIVHGEKDSGSLEDDVARVGRRRLGARGWEAHKQAIRQLWHEIDRLIDERGLDLGALAIYQDGLPVCGRELDIVRDLAGEGSHNHQIVQRLVDAGATVHGTEDPELLLAEYQRIKKQVRRRPTAPRRAAPRGRAAIARSLEPRDRFIAGRIDETLPADGTGLLFIGLMHDVAAQLPPDIAVEYLLDTAAVLDSLRS